MHGSRSIEIIFSTVSGRIKSGCVHDTVTIVMQFINPFIKERGRGKTSTPYRCVSFNLFPKKKIISSKKYSTFHFIRKCTTLILDLENGNKSSFWWIESIHYRSTWKDDGSIDLRLCIRAKPEKRNNKSVNGVCLYQNTKLKFSSYFTYSISIFLFR